MSARFSTPDTIALTAPPADLDTATVAATPASDIETTVAPEQIGLWGLLGILYPLLLLVGLRLLRVGAGRTRAWFRRRLDAWCVWMRGAGIAESRVLILRQSGDLGLRLAELAAYLLCIYAFSLYFFLLIPGTRDLGIGMAAQLWPPLRASFLLAWRMFTYLAFAVLVLVVARLAVLRLRVRLGTDSAHPGTARERERLFVLHSVVWMVRFLAAVAVTVVLPGPGRIIGVLMLAFAALIVTIAMRRTLENVAAGFSVGRASSARRGTRIACGGCEGVVEEWTMTGLRVRDDQGRLVHLPYRLCEEAPLSVSETDGQAGP